jgi:cytosine/adenosine deaminase-related metal-dependent hydrolase
MSTLVIENAAVVTVDAAGTEYADGHLVAVDGRITSVGAGSVPAGSEASTADGEHTRRVDGRGCLLTPGLVNTHHHLYQWLTRGMATQATLFEWLEHLYPVWGRLDAGATYAAARAGLGWLALSGCTTSTDHHYVFPSGVVSSGAAAAEDPLDATVAAAREIGLRFHPCRGSMDLGQSKGGLPPDDVVEDLDTVLARTHDAIARHHDPAPGALTRIAVAPCSPFSVTSHLMTESAALARDAGVRLHTHLAETLDEEAYCKQTHGCDPVEYLDSLGWLGPDVWLAHTVHLSDAAVKRLADTGTGIAHCPSSNARLGAGIAPVRDLVDAGAHVGLGVDGPASHESGMLVEELRQALYAARLRGGPTALTPRDSLHLGTMGGAHCLGRADEIGSLEVGKIADVVLWRLDGPGHVGIADPVAALVLGPPAPVAFLAVGGEPVVEDGALCSADADVLARDVHAASRRIQSAGART